MRFILKGDWVLQPPRTRPKPEGVSEGGDREIKNEHTGGARNGLGEGPLGDVVHRLRMLAVFRMLGTASLSCYADDRDVTPSNTRTQRTFSIRSNL